MLKKPKEHKKQLPVEHNIYLNDLLFDMCIETDLNKKGSMEEMYLIRLVRLQRMDYETDTFMRAYETYMRIADGIYREAKNGT